MRRILLLAFPIFLLAGETKGDGDLQTISMWVDWYHIWVDSTLAVHRDPLDTVEVTDTIALTLETSFSLDHCFLLGDTLFVEFWCPVRDTNGQVRDTLKCMDAYVAAVDTVDWGLVLKWYQDNPWILPIVEYDTVAWGWECGMDIWHWVRLASRQYGSLRFTDYARFPGTWIGRARYVRPGVPTLLEERVKEDTLQVVDHYVDVEIVKNDQETLQVFGEDTLRVRYHENMFAWLRVELWENGEPVRESAWVMVGVGHTKAWREVPVGVDFGEDIGAIYRVRVVAVDLFGNEARDSVWVVVMPEIQVSWNPSQVRPTTPAFHGFAGAHDETVLQIVVLHPRTGKGMAGIPFEIQFEGIPRTGGHDHQQEGDHLHPPLGQWIPVDSTLVDTFFSRQDTHDRDTFQVIRGHTDTAGQFTIRYTPGEVSGLRLAKIIPGRPRGDSARFLIPETLVVRFDEFEELGPGEGYSLVGETVRHQENHYGRDVLIQFIQELARRASREIPSEHLYINDMSLPWGGMFDVCGTYWPPDACNSSTGTRVNGHNYHRAGIQVDLSGSGEGGYSINDPLFRALMRKIARDVARATLRLIFHNRHYHITLDQEVAP